MKRKKINKSYTMSVNDKRVILSIKDNNEKSHKIITPSTKEPRVVAPLPDLEKLMDNAQYFSAKGLAGGTVKGFLDKYIRDQEEHVDNQIMEIRKALKRIERSCQSIDIVNKYMESI